jgi:hypothetical protein
MTQREDDALFTAVDTSRTKSVDYATAYVKYQSCMNINSGSSTAVCDSLLDKANPSSNAYDTQLNYTTSLANTRAADTTYMKGADYTTSKAAVIATDTSNRKKQKELQDIEDGTEYAMAKREADAVVYAWTLWVLVFFITAAAVFMYT